MEVGWAADIVVTYRRPVRGGCRPLAIEVVLQNRVDRAIGACTDLERTTASGFEPFAAIALDKPQDADAGAEPCLRGVRSRRMISTSAEVWRPISSACRRSRSGVQSA